MREVGVLDDGCEVAEMTDFATNFPGEGLAMADAGLAIGVAGDGCDSELLDLAVGGLQSREEGLEFGAVAEGFAMFGAKGGGGLGHFGDASEISDHGEENSE